MSQMDSGLLDNLHNWIEMYVIMLPLRKLVFLSRVFSFVKPKVVMYVCEKFQRLLLVNNMSGWLRLVYYRLQHHNHLI